mgnify:CR=1 FL=1
MSEKNLASVEDSLVVSDSSAILQIIERAAINPEVDIDKMERLMAMKERMDSKDAESLFNKAMTAAQGEMKRVSADAQNPQTRSKYASYAALDKALRPIYTENGFALSFDTEDGAIDGCMRVVCHLSQDRKSTRLNSSHQLISYAVFCLKKKKQHKTET